LNKSHIISVYLHVFSISDLQVQNVQSLLSVMNPLLHLTWQMATAITQCSLIVVFGCSFVEGVVTAKNTYFQLNIKKSQYTVKPVLRGHPWDQDKVTF